MRDEYIEGIWNLVPMHICCFTARIHESPVEELGSIRQPPEREFRDRCSAVFEVDSIRKEWARLLRGISNSRS